jgi:hypothetical protein
MGFLNFRSSKDASDEKPPMLLKLRSSNWFILTAISMGVFTVSFNRLQVSQLEAMEY